MKTIFTKLAEQFKNHLINTENNRKEVDGRLTAVRSELEGHKLDTAKSHAESEERFDNKLKDQHSALETHVNTKVSVTHDKLTKLEEELNKDVEILKESLENNREIFTNRLNTLLQQTE